MSARLCRRCLANRVQCASGLGGIDRFSRRSSSSGRPSGLRLDSWVSSRLKRGFPWLGRWELEPGRFGLTWVITRCAIGCAWSSGVGRWWVSGPAHLGRDSALYFQRPVSRFQACLGSVYCHLEISCFGDCCPSRCCCSLLCLGYYSPLCHECYSLLYPGFYSLLYRENG